MGIMGSMRGMGMSLNHKSNNSHASHNSHPLKWGKILFLIQVGDSTLGS